MANAWGEQEENPDTLILENYNKAYLSTIPADWDSGVYNNVTVTQETINNDFSRNTEKVLLWPNSYNNIWTDELLTYLEPRKMLGIYEYFILPELVYFRFDFGLKVKRSYNWSQVRDVVRNKLEYYFQNSNRNFGEVVDFREVVEYILDTNNVSPDDDFDLVRGIQYLTVRDIMIYRNGNITDLETVTEDEHCEFMGGDLLGEISNIQLSSVVDNSVGSVIGVYNNIPTEDSSGIGAGATVDIEVAGTVTGLVNETPTNTFNNVEDGTYNITLDGDGTGTGAILGITFFEGNITETTIIDGGVRFLAAENIVLDYTDLPPSAQTTSGSATYVVDTIENIIISIAVNNGGTLYASGETADVDAHYIGGTSGQVTFTVDTVISNDCSINEEIDEMYIYPENIYNYFPHYIELGYEQNNVDTTYNDLQPIQLGFKQFPQIAIDMCVFTNEG